MALVEAQQAFLNLTEAVADAGYGLQTFKDVPTEKVFEALHNAGYSEVVTDSGQIMWSKPWWNTSGATTTATAGETMGQDLISSVVTEAGSGEGLVNITASSVGFTSEVSGITEGVSMIAKTPKLAIVTAVASACGLAFGFDLGQELVDLYFGDDNFDWSTDSIGGKILTFISGEKTYIDENLANRIKDKLIDIGAYDSKKVEPITPTDTSIYISEFEKISLGELISISPSIWQPELMEIVEHFNLDLSDNTNGWKINCGYNNPYYTTRECWINYTNANNPIQRIISYGGDSIYSTENILPSYITNNYGYKLISTGTIVDTTSYRKSTNPNGSIKYDWYTSGRATYHSPWTESFDSDTHPFFIANNLTGISTGGIPGVNKQPDATYPTINTPLTTTYPSWNDNKGKVPTKDGEKTVIPLKIPKPNEGTNTQNEAQSGTYTDTDPYIAELISNEQLPNNPDNIPTKDGGNTPTPTLPPTGIEGTGFVALYNPTQSQLSDFSQYLWSDNFIDNFKKLFTNPMDAIIGLHLIYATPSRGNDAEIVCGYAHSGVTSKTVNNQYIEIDCGSIKVNRYFNNVLDYNPYTHIQAYLPFVGIVDLDTNELMNGELNIKYRIDVLTGSCLARLRVTRGDYNAELYNFAGNCAVQLPISGGSYSGIIANAIGVAGSIGATVASGGALAPVMVGSAVSSVTNSHFNVAHSGSLGSNAGALGIMKPYLIITRPKPAEADNYQNYYGKPTNKTVKLKNCSGFTKVKETHLEGINATNNELEEIETILKEGIII